MSDEVEVKGEAPPEEESHKDGEFKPPKDGSWLPRSRVKEMIASAVTKAKDEFSAQVAPLIEAAKAKNEVKAAPVQQYTKAQLSEFVEAGRLTQEAADQVWENQIVERATRQAVESANNVVASRDQQRNIVQQMAEFKNLVPEAWEVGSSERERVEDAYAALKSVGIKGTKDELELAALIAAFGDPAKIRKARGFGRSGPAESFEDAGSAGRRSRGEEAEGPPRNITSEQRAHYERGIAAGRYKDWSDVKEELKFAIKAKRA